ncbi:MAG: efflux RND transporter periplasmic adaptor subunit [Hyphomonadaceae bacterium]
MADDTQSAQAQAKGGASLSSRFDVRALARRPAMLRYGGLALFALVAVWFFFLRDSAPKDPYRTAAADRGAITQVVSATGALQPLVSVNVGSTVSGPVQSVEVDFNSTVRAGQVLARLDPSSFQQRVQQAQATLAQAQADAQVAVTDYTRYAQLDQAGYASQQLMAQQRAARAKAQASVASARAALASARTDLDRATIRSPINGVVVDRQINPGQSVAASFQAPTLFVIAQDLSRLQANITVDEADIGQVRQGMPVHFTVDAFPDEQFDGAVSQVRQQGANTNGVVSYTVVVEADNPGHRLLPGMTANAEIVVQEVPNVLRVPNAALRFRPSDESLAARGQALLSAARQGGAGQGAQNQNQAAAGGGRGGLRVFESLNLTPAQQEQARQILQSATAAAGAPPGADAAPAERRAFMRRVREAAMRRIDPILTPAQRTQLAALRAGGAIGAQRTAPSRPAVVWVLRNDKPTPVRVLIGLADDSFTAITGGDLKAGDEVITGGGPQPKAGQERGGRQSGPMGGAPNMRIRGM